MTLPHRPLILLAALAFALAAPLPCIAQQEAEDADTDELLLDINMRGSLEGIGATLREEDGYIKVVSIIPGSPSARQGQLHAEDVILMVAQGNAEPVDVTDTRLREAVSLIRGLV